MIPKAEDSKVLLGEPHCSSTIPFGNLRDIVLAAVEFDDQALFQANEIGDIVVEGRLSAELVTVDLTLPQLRPQIALRIGHVRAQLAGAIAEGDFRF